MADDSMREIRERVKQKKEDYRRYNFERLQEEAFATFFDLAQEYTSLKNLYMICVAVPEAFFQLKSRLYVIHPKTSQLEKVCTSEEGLIQDKEERLNVSVKLSESGYETDVSLVFPIRGNRALTYWLPFHSQHNVLGLFEIEPKDKVDAKNHFFLEKFTNRIGYNLHQKMLIQQNIEHIKFINQLVADIEHNVISPNLYYRLFLLRLRKNLESYQNIQEKLRNLILFYGDCDEPHCRQLCELYHDLSTNNENLETEWKSLSKHYEHTSLFLETLLRRDHFEKGTYVLRKQPCNFRSEIIEPILERYRPIFAQRGITLDTRLEEIPDEEVTLFVDKGLISQVFDNLFSNAVKYTREVQDATGRRIKLVSYNRKILRDYFGEGIHGVQFNIFSTGEPLPENEAEKLFDEGYRGSNVGDERGMGHGLHFVRNVVEIHGGRVGFEPKDYGNVFYFILPLKEEVSVEQLG